MNAQNNMTSRHRETWDLIPWLVNGRCTEAEQRQAAEHLASCADCRAELALQHEIRLAVQSAPEPEVRDPQPALRQLWARIDAQPPQPMPQAGTQSNALPATQAATHPSARKPPKAASNKRWTGRWLVQGLVAAVAAEAMGLAMLSAALWLHTEQGARYQTLSTPAAATQRATIRAVFAPTLTLAAVQAMLAQERLQIVAGPGDTGVYTLAPVLAQSDAASTRALKRLRNQPGVLFAEPVEPGG
jgi:hypothetical protein